MWLQSAKVGGMVSRKKIDNKKGDIPNNEIPLNGGGSRVGQPREQVLDQSLNLYRFERNRLLWDNSGGGLLFTHEHNVVFHLR